MTFEAVMAQLRKLGIEWVENADHVDGDDHSQAIGIRTCIRELGELLDKLQARDGKIGPYWASYETDDGYSFMVQAKTPAELRARLVDTTQHMVADVRIPAESSLDELKPGHSRAVRYFASKATFRWGMYAPYTENSQRTPSAAESSDAEAVPLAEESPPRRRSL